MSAIAESIAAGALLRATAESLASQGPHAPTAVMAGIFLGLMCAGADAEMAQWFRERIAALVDTSLLTQSTDQLVEAMRELREKAATGGFDHLIDNNA